MSMTTKRTPRPYRPSRKKYGAALAMLKQAVALESLSWVQRLRAAELILAIYELATIAPVQPLTGHHRRVVKDLIEDSRFETHIRKQVRAARAAEIEQEERAAAAAIHPAETAAAAFIAGRALPQPEQMEDQQHG